MRDRALVTGGAGFIGSNLVDGLLARDRDVTVLDDLSTGRLENLVAALNAGAQLHTASVTDTSALERAFEDARPDIVFHLAAQIDVRRAVEDPGFDATANVLGTLNVLETARWCGVRRFVLASTGGASTARPTKCRRPRAQRRGRSRRTPPPRRRRKST